MKMPWTSALPGDFNCRQFPQKEFPGELRYQLHKEAGVTMYFPDEVKDQLQHNIIARLKKIEGQIRGLQHMIGDDKPCEQILIQVRAAQSALKSVSNLLLKSFLMKCLSDIGENPSPEVWAKLDKTVGVLTKFISN